MKQAKIYLREWRKLRSLNQEQLAGRLDTTAATISRWECGKANWTKDALEQIAYALQCDPIDLFRDPGQPETRAWAIIRGMKPEMQERAVRILEALATEDSRVA